MVESVAMMVTVKDRLWAAVLPRGRHFELWVLREPGMPGREQDHIQL